MNFADRYQRTMSFANRESVTAGLDVCCADIMAKASNMYCTVTDVGNHWVITIGELGTVAAEYPFATGTEAVQFLCGVRAALAALGYWREE